MRSALVGSALLAINAWSACAWPARADDCAGTTQADLNACAAQDFNKADGALNATYKKLMQKLDGDVAQRKLLVQAQQAWLKFRDTECDFSSAGTIGGSAHPMVVAGCQAGLTTARVKMLQGYLTGEEGDLNCAAGSK